MNLKQSSRLFFAIVAVAASLSIGGCNTSQPNSEIPNPETSTPQTPTTPSPWQKIELRRTIEAHTSPIRTLAISPDNLTLASGSFGGKLKLWKLQNGKLLHTKDMKTEVRSIVF